MWNSHLELDMWLLDIPFVTASSLSSNSHVQTIQEFFVPTVCQSMHFTAMEKNKSVENLNLFVQTYVPQTLHVPSIVIVQCG